MRHRMSLPASRSVAIGPVRWVAVATSLLLLLSVLPAQLAQPAAAQEDSTYSISVRKYDCPAGFDAYNKVGQETFDTCTSEATGIPFSVTTDDGTYQNDTRNSGSDGGSQASWSDIPLNTTFTLQEAIPDGYGLPMIYCQAYVLAWNANQGYATPSFSYGNGNVSAHLDDSYAQYPNLDCYWFNVPLDNGGNGSNNDGNSYQNGGNGTITIRKWICWLDYDSGNLTPAYDDLSNNCTAGYRGARFQAQYNANNWQNVSPDQNGVVSYDQYHGGQFAIRELEPWPHPVTAVVYCAPIDDQGKTGAYDQSYQEGSEIRANLDPGWGLTCDWFNIFYPSIRVVKYACDNTKDYRQTTLDELFNACKPAKDVDFDLKNGVSSTQTTGNDGRFDYYFTMNQASEPVTIAEKVPAGYAYVRVFCSETKRGDNPTNREEVETSALGAYTYDHERYAQVACAFFNIPEYDTGAYGTITIYKLVCDDGFDGSSQNYQDYIDGCDEQTGVNYTVAGSGGYSENQAVGENGYAQWDKTVQYGSLTITEHPPAGYATWKVFCGTYQDDPSEVASYDPISTGGNGIAWNLDEGYNLTCYWVNQRSTTTYGTVTIYKYACPSGYDGSSTDYQDYVDNCAEQDGVDYDLSGSGGYQESRQVANGYAQWDKSVPYGDLTIVEHPLSGYATWKIFCGTYQDDPSEVSSYDPVAPSNDNEISWHLDEGYNLICYWFNYPSSSNGGTIVIHKYDCPPVQFVTTPTHDDWLGVCERGNAGVQFSVSQGGPADLAQTDPSGDATFSGYGAGPVTISEPSRTGYADPVVYCRTYPSGGSAPDYEEQQVNDWSLAGYDLQDGYAVECDWFNLRIDTYGSITIYKFVCDPQYDNSNLGKDYLASNCEAASGYEFSLDDPGNGSGSITTDDNGKGDWTDVPAGARTLSEAQTEGYRPFAVYCTAYPYGGQEGSYDPYDLAGGWSIDIDLQANYQIVCYWFNEPYTTTYGTVTIYKYVCKEGYDSTVAGYQDLLDGCPDEQPGATYNLTRSDGSSESQTVGDNGYAQWDKSVPDGSLTIEEQPLSGYTTGAVYCGVYKDDPSEVSSYDPVSVSGNAIDWELPPSYSLICYWFNVPYTSDTYGTVILYKYQCPSDFAYSGATKEYAESACDAPHAEITFQLTTTSGNPQSRTTDSKGKAEWDNIAPGKAVLRELNAGANKAIVVFCAVDNGSWNPASVKTGRISLDIAAGKTVVCEWFNVRSGGSGGSGSNGGNQNGNQGNGNAKASLILVKYLCPLEYDPFDPASHPTEDCEAVKVPVTFTLGAWAAKATTQTKKGTQAKPNTVTFDKLDAGDYLAAEVPPKDQPVAAAFILECRSDLGGGETTRYPLVPIGTDLRLVIALQAGETLTCDWYNIPRGENTISFTVYECPGRVANPRRCTVASDTHDLDFGNTAAQGKTVTAASGPDGRGAVTVSPGTYEVTETDGNVCLVDSDATDNDGNLVVAEGDAIEADIYTCQGS